MEPEDKYFIFNDNPIYKNTVFNRFFEENDKAVLAWAENVLDKVSGNGILPQFVEKDGDDFRAFWGTITHYFALIVLYSRKYKEIDVNQILFETFIENRGLITNLVSTQEQMQYLFQNYIKEYEKRGRLDIVNKEGLILGELLRLIRYVNTDEFIFAPLKPQETGWVVGFSSPTWRRTNTSLNIIKGYEYSESVQDLSKYPLVRFSLVKITEDENNQGDLVNVMTLTGNQFTGISSEDEKDHSKFLIIDSSLSYEISLYLKVQSLLNTKIHFGVECFDKDFNKIGTQIIQNGEYIPAENNFFHTTEYLELIQEGYYYNLTGILLAYNERGYDNLPLNFISGRALSFLPDTKYICPILTQNREDNNDPIVYLYDIKIRPLELPFEQGYLGRRYVIASYYKNNSYQNENSIDSFIRNYLISYKNILGAEEIKEKSSHTVFFKVFSERNNYLPNVIITIAGQTLKTDENGEIQINLYPGRYIYSVELENYFSIERDFLLVEDFDFIKYIRLQATSNERSVVFFVRDTEGVALEGVAITLNEQTIQTSEAGLATFELLPGFYVYKAEKYDYIPIERSIFIEDNMIVEVELEHVAYFNVSIRVREGLNPIPGAGVILTGDFDGSGSIQELVGSTDEKGIASGFSMRAGTYHYLVSKKDFFTKESDFTIINNATINVDLIPIPYYNVTYIVKKDGTPVNNVTIDLEGNTLTTNENGVAVFRMTDGDYNYTVSKLGYVTQKGKVQVLGANITIEIDFKAIVYKINFIVSSQNNIPISGAVVLLESESLITDDQGYCFFTRENGQYNYSIDATNYYPYESNVTVNGSDVTVRAKLTEITYTITFTVRKEGTPMSDIPVICDGETLTTNNQGIVIFNRPNGNYDWYVSVSGYDRKEGQATVSNNNTSINVDLVASVGTVIFKVAQQKDPSTVIPGAIIDINGEQKVTSQEGTASYQLVYGIYSYTVTIVGYNTYTGNVEVNRSEQEKLVLLTDAPEYTLEFYVVEDGKTNPDGSYIPLQGAIVVINNTLQNITNEQGLCSFGLVPDLYRYKVSYGDFFIPFESEVRILDANKRIVEFLKRKKTNVTFRLKDLISGSVVQGVSVTFSGSTKTTNEEGWVIFPDIPLSLAELPYLCSKKPPYNDVSGKIAITQENQTVEVVMGEYTYSATFTVKDSITGNPLSQALVTCAGQSVRTNDSGQVTISGLKTNNYTYSVVLDNYQTYQGSFDVTNKNVSISVLMVKLLTKITIHVQLTDDIPLSGVSVTLDNGNSVATNDNGDAIFQLNSGTYKYSIKSEFKMDTEGSFENKAEEKTIVVNIEDTFAISGLVNGVQTYELPIHNTSQNGLSDLKIDWGDGTITIGQIKHSYLSSESVRRTIKISFGSSQGILLWGFGIYNLNTESAERKNFRENFDYLNVEGFFKVRNFIEYKEGAFAYSKLYDYKSFAEYTNLGQTKSQVSGTARSMFRGCSRIESIPENVFDWRTSDGDYSSAFESVNNILIVGDVLSTAPSVSTIEYMFKNCSKLSTSYLKVPSDCENAEGLFFNCTNLGYVDTNTFLPNAVLTNLQYTFYSTNIKVNPLLGNLTGAVDLSYAFESSSIENFKGAFPPHAVKCVSTFQNSKLSQTEEVLNINSDSLSETSYMFYSCTELGDLNNIQLNCLALTTADSMFRGTSINSIPANFFSNCPRCQNFRNVFSQCSKIQFIYGEKETSPFYGTNASTVESAFEDCTALQGPIQFLFWSRYNGITLTFDYKGVTATCTNYTNCFSGCRRLANRSCMTSYWPGRGVNVDRYIYENKDPQFLAAYTTLVNAAHANCYRGCTLLSDEEFIPNSWK